MLLATPHQSITAKLSSSPATMPDFMSSATAYAGYQTSGFKAKHGTLDGTNRVQVVENPSSDGEVRRCNSLMIANRHSAAVTVTVEYKDGTTYRVLCEIEVGVDQTLQWNGEEWTLFPEEHNSVVVADLTTTGALVVGTTLSTGTDATIGDDLVVTDDCQIGGDLVVQGVTTLTGAVGCSSTLDVTGNVTASADLEVVGDLHLATFGTISPIAAKGDLLAGTANDTLGVLSVGSDNNCLIADSSQATGLNYGRRSLQYGAQIADASAWHSSTAESGALYTQTIVAGRINTTRAKVRVKVRGKASTTGSPSLTLRVYMNDGAGAQTIGTVTSALPGTSATDVQVTLDFEAVVRTTGSTGTVDGHQRGGIGTSTTDGCRALGQITLDLTAAIDVTVTAQWSASSASNTVTLTGMEVEIL